MIKRKAIDFLRVFLFAGILLAISSLFYSYKNFALETVLLFVVLGVGLVFRPAKVLAVLFSFFYFLMFVVFNYNYIFILGLCIVVGLLIYDVIQDRLNVHPWVYVLIPLFILFHVIWFNVLPFGFAATYTLDVGSENDLDSSQALYLVDSPALGPRTCVEGECFREINGTVEIGFNPEIVLDNDTYLEIDVDLVAKNDVYLQVGDDLYPLYLKELDGVEPLYTVGDIEVYGPENNSEIYDLVMNSDPSFFDVPKYYFFPENESDVLFDLDLSIPLENNSDFIVINESQKDLFECDGVSCINVSSNETVDKEILVVYGDPTYVGDGYEFDGVDDYIEVLGSYDRFENESFVVEAEFESYNSSTKKGLVIGHYSWELYIDRNDLEVFYGRFNNDSGDSLSLVNSGVDNNSLKRATTVYKKKDQIELYRDNNLKATASITNKSLLDSYNKEFNLQLGDSKHAETDFFKGFISRLNINQLETIDKFIVKNKQIEIVENQGFILTNNNTLIKSIKGSIVNGAQN